jgi:hypothetical protein
LQVVTLAAYTMYRGQSPLPPAAPPGRAIPETCADCQGRGCDYCDGRGRILYRACPRCGDVAWDLVNGRDEAAGMACRIGCGYRWAADDPGWLLQRLPS